VARAVFLTDRPPTEALPALPLVGFDVKTEPLAADSLADLADLAPTVVIVDAEANAEQAWALLSGLTARRIAAPVVVLLRRDDLERFAWPEVADDLVYGGTPAPELRTRLGMLLRRAGGASDAMIRLGPVAVNVETYQVTVAGAPMDLTYKEFELLRFLVQRPGRVFTRNDLLQEVWGYNFYGGTRTVDVHVRRLRAKLGAEHEGLIETVRGVGYRAAQVGDQSELTS